MELREMLRVVRRSWIVIVVVMVAAIGAGFAVLAFIPPTYESETKLMFTPASSTGTVQDQVQGNNLIIQRLPTYAELAATSQVLGVVITNLGLPTTVADLAESVTADVSDNSALITITTTAETADGAANLANAVGAQLIAEAGKTSVVNETGAVTGIQGAVVEPAIVPEQPSSPNRLLTLAISVALGLAVAFVIVVLREALNSRIRNATDLAKATDAPVLGSVPGDRVVRKSGPALPTAPKVAFTESFRQLRTRLHALDSNATPHVLVVSSPGYKEGKSTVAAQLSIAIADSGRNVTLVDANLRRPVIGEMFDVASDESLSDFLDGTVEAFKPATVTESERLSVVTTTAVDGVASDLLSSPRMAAAIELAGRDAEIVVVDAGPLVPVADASALAPMATAYIVVTRAGHTAIADVAHSVRSVREAGGHVLGVVLNRAARRGPEARV